MSARRLLQLLAVLTILSWCSQRARTPAAQPRRRRTTAPTRRTHEGPGSNAAAPSGKTTIAGVVFQSDTFMQTVQAGMQAAADKAGVELILGNTDNKLDKEAIDDRRLHHPRCQGDRDHADLGGRLGRGAEEGEGCRHHDHLLQHLRQRQDDPLGVPGHQERGPGHQVGRGGGEVHHRQAGRQGQGRRPELRPVRRLPAAQGRLRGRS